MGIVQAESKSVLSAFKAIGGENFILALDIINWHSKVFYLFPVKEDCNRSDITVICVAGLAYAAFYYYAVAFKLQVNACGEGLFEHSFFCRDNSLKTLLVADGLRFFHVDIDAIYILFVAPELL